MANLQKTIKGIETQLDDLRKFADKDQPLTLTQEQAKEILELLKSKQAEIEPSEAEMMVEHTDGTVEYVKDIDSIMLSAHKDYSITYTGAF